MVTELPARRDLCDDKIRQATLVDFRGSSSSDPGSIPGISTVKRDTPAVYLLAYRFNYSLDTYIRLPSVNAGYLCYKKQMKKLLLGCLLFITACQPATPTPISETSFFPTTTSLPTLLPDTPTPEPTQTFEPSPTALPRFFTHEFDSSIAGWVILQAGNDSVPNIKTENGTLLLQMDSPFIWLYALYGAEDYADVRIDTQFQNQGGTPASAGLVCRYGEEQGWFEFNVSTDGTYNVLYGKWLSAGIAEYLPITDDGSSTLIQPSGATQTIGLICSDTTLSLYINDTVLRRVDVARYELAEGKVGLTTAAYGNIPVLAAFDWVKVSEP